MVPPYRTLFPPRLRLTAALALLVLLGLSAGASAQDAEGRRSIALESELSDRAGGAWTVHADPQTGLPTVVYGTGIDLGRPLTDADTVLAEAYAWIEEHRDFLGLGDLDLDGQPILAGSTWYLNLNLLREGVPLSESSRVDLRFKPNGVLAAIFTNRIPTTIDDVAPQNLRGAAESVALDTMSTLTRADLRVADEAALEILVDENGHGHLAWKLHVTSTRGGRRFARDCWVAARGEARVLEARNRIYQTDVTGDVKGRGHLFGPRSNLVELPLRNLEVQVTDTGNTTLTDTDGNFVVPNPGTEDVTLVAELKGPFVDVNTQDGGTDLRYEKQHTPGTPVPVRFHTMPPGGDPRQASQVDAFYHTNVVHDYLRSVLDLPALDTPIPCNVNLTATNCNAFYTDGTINFYAEGNNCVNMAFDTIVYHEYGHFLDDMTGGIIDRALTEGLADMIAAFTSGQPEVGEDYRIGNQFLRTTDNDRVWPAAECGSSNHCKGETFSGFCWHTRERLIQRHGMTAGVAIAETIVLQSLFANAISIPRAVLEVFIQDDDDGDLSNRTPNYRQLALAALRHGFDPPAVELFRFDHVAPPIAVSDTVNDLPIVATISALAGPVTSPTLLYSLDDGIDYAEVAMKPGETADEWTAAIPAQPCGTWIKYYFRASDSAGNTRLYPAEAPGPLRRRVFSFHIGRSESIFFEDFESGIGGWTHGASAGEDDWEVGTPNPSGTHAFDPVLAYSGTSVAGTDLSGDGNYADDTVSFLQSPVIDASAAGDNIWLRFQHYNSTERSENGDTLKFRVESATVFRNDSRSGEAAPNWYTFERDISLFARDNMELDLTFELESNDSVSAGGWNIDDVRVDSLFCDLVTLSVSQREVRGGDSVTVTITGGADEPYYVFSDRRFGNATFQVPGGPLIETGLTDNQMLRVSANLDSSGMRQITRQFPTNPALVGKHFVLVTVSKNVVWQRSNFFEIDVVP